MLELLGSMVCVSLLLGQAHAQGPQRISALWITCNSPQLTHVVLNWTTTHPGPSQAELIWPDGTRKIFLRTGQRRLHQVRLPLARPWSGVYRYRVRTAEAQSPWHQLRLAPRGALCVAVVANWHQRPSLVALMKDEPHVLMTAGDNVPNLYTLCGAGRTKCVKPYEQLVLHYPELFSRVVFMPVLGNHDKQIRPRGRRFPPQPVYDIAAEAFCRFFPLPDKQRWWHLDVPEFGVRFAALDLHHVQDQGTTWQSCSAYDPSSAQFRWYASMVRQPRPPVLITLYNARNATVRHLAGGAWGKLLGENTLCVSGFGHFGERAQVGQVTYYNTSLRGTGDRYPDPHSRRLVSQDNYLLLTFRRTSEKVSVLVELKNLRGQVLDARQHEVPLKETSNK